MKFIAHRGLFQGPDKDKENNPDQIYEALGKGFDVEIILDVMRVVTFSWDMIIINIQYQKTFYLITSICFGFIAKI